MINKPCGLTRAYFSSDERQDVHLPRLALLDGGDDETGAAQNDLASGPAVHRQLELPFPDVIGARQLDPLRALNALGLPCKTEKRALFMAAEQRRLEQDANLPYLFAITN